jgi:hypothetical protein
MSEIYSITNDRQNPLIVNDNYGNFIQRIEPFGHAVITLPMMRERLKTTMRRVAADKAGLHLPKKLIGAILKSSGKK